MTLPPEKRDTHFNQQEHRSLKGDPGLASSLLDAQISTSHHMVQFYRSDDHLFDAVSRFMRVGFGQGATCVSIATEVHDQGIQQRLQAQGVDLSVLLDEKKYLRRDASQTLSHCLNQSMPDSQAFLQMVGRLTARAEQEQRPVYIFGEMVQILWTQGNPEAATLLEGLWNDLLATRPSFSLLCAYQIQSAPTAEDEAFIEAVCQQHSHIIPDEGSTALISLRSYVNVIAQWRQQGDALAREVRARRVAEDRLRRVEHRSQHLFETATEGIVLVNAQDATIVDANPSFSELLGTTREDLLYQKLWQWDLFPDQEHLHTLLQQVEMQQGIWYEKVSFRTRDEKVEIVEVISSLLQAHPLPIVVCHVHSITDRLQLQATLHEQETRFRHLANQAPFIIWQSDDNGSARFLNAAWCIFTGLSQDQGLGTGWIEQIHPNDRRTAFTQWIQALVAQGPYHCQVRLHGANGGYSLVQIDATPWVDLDGVFLGFIGTMRERMACSPEHERGDSVRPKFPLE